MSTKRKRSSSLPERGPVQYSNFDAPGRRALDPLMQGMGRAASRAASARRLYGDAIAAATSSNSPAAGRTAKKNEQALERLAVVEPHLTNRRVTLDSAASNRTGLVRRGVERSRRDGTGLEGAGAGWYFEHRRGLNQTASQFKMDESRVVKASALMSPQNAPENERRAVHALAQLHAENPELHFNEKTRKSLGLKADKMRYSDLTPDQASKIGSPKHRAGITGVHEDVLKGVASGGGWKNVAKAIHTLRGGDYEISPSTSPKVWSYHEAIQNARPDTPEHMEYMTRARTALHEMPGQQTMDLFGLRHSREGILNPGGHTAEDTWMNAISSGQKLEGTQAGRHVISPAKVVGTEKPFVGTGKSHNGVSVHPSPAATAEGVRHAWNNEATIRSARQLSEGTDVMVPSVLAQETAWTEGRREARKDKEYENRGRADAERAARTAKIQKKQQLKLPGVQKAMGTWKMAEPETEQLNLF